MLKSKSYGLTTQTGAGRTGISRRLSAVATDSVIPTEVEEPLTISVVHPLQNGNSKRCLDGFDFAHHKLSLDMTKESLLTKTAVADRAADLLPEYREIIATIPPEAGFGGIWESEMFLFYAAVKPFAPKQVLESGRARGKSTLILARCFPEARIISIEYDRQSENAPAAEAKLKSESNVDLLYGDSREILPQRLQTDDAVLIDGPKDFRALKLAVDLLRTGKPCAIFVHDFPPNSLQRKFVERNFPNAFFGDDPLFQRFQSLDNERDPRPNPQRRYGIFACLPPPLPMLYWKLRFRLLTFSTASV